MSQLNEEDGMVIDWLRQAANMVVRFALLLLLLNGAHALALVPLNVPVDRIGSDQGLEMGGAKAIIQDQFGFMWFGGAGGLVRYDGYQFVHHIHDKKDPGSLAHNIVRSLARDSTHRLWVATLGGLQWFHPETGRFERIALKDGQGENLSVSIRVLLEDKDKGLWIGTERGLLHYDAETRRQTYYDLQGRSQDTSSKAMSVRALAQSTDGTLWIGMASGIKLLRPGAAEMEDCTSRARACAAADGKIIEALHVDHAGDLWIGYQDGLERWSADGSRYVRFGKEHGFPSANVKKILQTPEGHLWVGSFAGVHYWNPERAQFQTASRDEKDVRTLPSNRVLSLYSSREGALWVADSDYGISKIGYPKSAFERITKRANPPGNLNDSFIVKLLEDKDRILWAGTLAGGLNRLDRMTGTVQAFVHDDRDPASMQAGDLHTVCQDPENGKMWVGTDQALSRFDPKTGVFDHSMSRVRNIKLRISGCAVEPGAGVWLLTEQKLYLFNPDTDTLQEFSHRPDDPDSIGSFGFNYNSLALFNGNELWISSSGGGLNKLLRKPNGEIRFMRFRHDASDPASLSNDYVASVYRTKGGELWVGTRDGLNLLVNENGRASFVRYGKEEGLADVYIASIAEDEAGNLWMGTDSGIVRLDAARKRFTRFDRSDILLENSLHETVVAKLADNTIAFGGQQGISLLHPERVRDVAQVPQVALTRLSLFNSVLSPGNLPEGVKMTGPVDRLAALTLSYRHLVFAFDFAALNFIDPSKSRYAYKLEGFDTDWIPTNPASRRATYTNLDPGDYVFRVRAAYKDGPWNDKDIAVKLTITPPFWKTWWFRGLMFLVMLALFYLWFRWYTRYVARRYEVEGMAVRARAELASAAAQQRFVAMVSHEFRNPLALMEATIRNMLRNREALPPQIDERVQKIQRAQKRMQGLIDNYLTEESMKAPDLQLRRHETDLRALLLDVVSYAQTATVGHEIALTMPEVLPGALVDREMIRVALSNLLDNAVKYSPGGGKIAVSASVNEAHFVIAVMDNGVGIPETALPHIFDKFFRADHGKASIHGVGLGLHLVKRIIELHGGAIEASSKAGERTVFTVRLPVDAGPVEMGLGAMPSSPAP